MRVWIVFALIFLTACSAPKGAESTSPAAPEKPKPIEVFNLAEVEVACPSGDCPEGVGVLLFLEKTDVGFILHRCTAFLSAPNEIISNGHCFEESYGEGYFFTQKKSFSKIAKIENKTIGAGASPDAAVFELETALKKIQPLKPARGAQVAYQNLTGYFSAAQGDSQIKLKLEKVQCVVHRHDQEFPFNLSEAPDVLRAFDCYGAKGNSGGPLFANGDFTTVEAIQQGIPEKTPARAWIQATNLRCLEFLAAAPAACTKVSDSEIETRVREIETSVQDQIFKRQAIDATSDSGLQFTTKVYRLTGSPEQFEVVHFPSCRVREVPATNFVLLSEHLKLTRDEWGLATVEKVETRTSAAEIKADGGDKYVFTAQWAEPFAVLENPAHDPRAVFGPDSAVALALCSR